MKMPFARRRRVIAALSAVALACSALGFALAAAGAAGASPAAARAEMARTTEHAPKTSANRLPIFAVIHDGDAIRVLRGETGRGDGRAFAHRMRALPAVLAAGVDGPVH